MAGARFTTWLNEGERQALRDLAARAQCSENFVMRMALRALVFGVPIPSYLQPEEKENDENTTASR